jgi:hypothetical protein
MPKPSEKPLEESLETMVRDLPPEINSAFSELRSIIKLTIPESTEKANPGWRSLNFSHPQVGYFCGLFPFPDRIDVVFEFGVLLADPDGIFDGHGKQVGFIRIHSTKEIRRGPFKRMLKAAVALPENRATRLALVKAGARPAAPESNLSKQG